MPAVAIGVIAGTGLASAVLGGLLGAAARRLGSRRETCLVNGTC
jgi:hypothetical protein